MSRLYYFASDVPLEACPNPHIEMLSVNEALARGVEVHLDLFPDSFDFDRPATILYTDSEDAFEHPNIFLIDPSDFFEDIGTQRAYCAELEWEFCSRTVHEVLSYIERQLAHAHEVELWSIWLGDRNIPETVEQTTIRLADLTPMVLQNFLRRMSQPFVEGENWCMTITR